MKTINKKLKPVTNGFNSHQVTGFYTYVGVPPYTSDLSILKKLKKIKKNITGIQVSIDGLEEYHNDFRGRTDAFKKSISFIKAAINQSYQITVATCISNQNKNEMELLCEMLKDMGVSIVRLGRVLEQGRAETNCIKLTIDDAIRIDQITKDLNERYSSKTFKVMAEEESIYIENRLLDNCGFGTLMLKIDPNGYVYPCIMSDIKIGNILENDIESILSTAGKKYAEIKKPQKKIVWRMRKKTIM